MEKGKLDNKINIEENSFPTTKVVGVEAKVGMPSETLSCEQDANKWRNLKEKLQGLETENIEAEMIIQCAHVLIRMMAETNAETAKWTIEQFSLRNKVYGDYLINIKRIASKS